MNKINFTFKGFQITDQQNGTYHLILVVSNDMAASIIYPIISTSLKVGLRHYLSNEHFDLFINLYDLDSYYEINPNVTSATEFLAKAIDNKLIPELWIGYGNIEKPSIYGTAISLCLD